MKLILFSSRSIIKSFFGGCIKLNLLFANVYTPFGKDINIITFCLFKLFNLGLTHQFERSYGLNSYISKFQSVEFISAYVEPRVNGFFFGGTGNNFNSTHQIES